MFIFVLLVLVAEAYSQHHQFFIETKNHTAVNPSNFFGRFSLSRQYAAPVETLVETYKPTSGYTYPSVPQKLQQFTHDNNLHIYLFQNKLSLYCATDTTYERITWRKYTCPSQIGNQPGEVVAVGPMVSNPHLYGVNSFGRNEEYVSELLLKQPITPQTDGAYVCEGTFFSDSYPHESLTTVRDIIIVGGKGMFQNCFSQPARFSFKRSIKTETSQQREGVRENDTSQKPEIAAKAETSPKNETVH